MQPLETLFETPWIRLHRRGHWDYVVRPQSPNCVGILAITPDEEILLVEQFRIPVQKIVIEIPAGIIGDEPEHLGESLSEAAGRELLEETGYRAGKITPLLVTPTSAGLTSEMIHFFYATELSREHNGGGTASEDITVHKIPLSQLRPWLQGQEKSGKLIDFKIHAALWHAGK